jgi:FMN phosphatase YigB (HAD superfamily)
MRKIKAVVFDLDNKIYEKKGIEDQLVFNKLLEKVLGRVDWHILDTLPSCKTDTRGAP